MDTATFTDSELRELRDSIESTESRAEAKLAKADEMLDSMRDEGVNPLTDREAFEKFEAVEKEGRGLMDEASSLRARYQSALESGRRERKTNTRESRELETRERDTRGPSFSARYLESDDYKRFNDIRQRDLEAAVKSTGAIEVATRDEARQLLQRAVTSDALVENDVQGGILNPNPYRPVRALDLITVGNTDSDTVEYVKENAPTENVNDAAYGTDPDVDAVALTESDYSFSDVTLSTDRIGHFTPASEKQLADAGQLASLLDVRLRNGVRRRLETLVVNGNTANGDAFDGILQDTGIASYARDTANGESRADAAFKAITKVRVNTEGESPTAIGIHPNDWQDYVLEKDSSGNYLNGRGSVEPQTVWGLRPVVSTVFPEGNPLVGDYNGAYLWMRTGIAVAMSESHKDWFLKGWIAMKAQVRAAFGVVIARNFCEVTSF